MKEMNLSFKDRLIVALDRPDFNSAKSLVEELGNLVSRYKVGIELFTACGGEILNFLKEKNKKVFLDLKFHDIPETVSRASLASLKYQPFMINIHLFGGELMARETVKRVKEFSGGKGKTPPLIIGVTVLTSLGKTDLEELGINKDLEEIVKDFALMGKRAGLDGVVASSQEVKMIKDTVGRDFLVVTPGIRLSPDSADDQKRIAAPEEALRAGADFLVVGRPITKAPDICQAAKHLLDRMKEADNA